MWYCTHTSKFVTGEDQMLSELISCTGKQRDTENSGRYWICLPLIVVMVSQVFVYVPTQLYTLNMCSSLYINYTSITVLKINKYIFRKPQQSAQWSTLIDHIQTEILHSPDIGNSFIETAFLFFLTFQNYVNLDRQGIWNMFSSRTA